MIRSFYKAQEPYMLAPNRHGYMGVVTKDFKETLNEQEDK